MRILVGNDPFTLSTPERKETVGASHGETRLKQVWDQVLDESCSPLAVSSYLLYHLCLWVFHFFFFWGGGC